MKLKSHIAVAYKVVSAPAHETSNPVWRLGERHELVTSQEYAHLLQSARLGFVVILEAWQMGKCISN